MNGGEELFGEWHVLTVERYGDASDEVDWEVEHLPACPMERQVHGPEYACSLGAEVTNRGFEEFEVDGPLAPGRYRVRTWARSSYVHYYGSTEWDAGVDVEALPAVS